MRVVRSAENMGKGHVVLLGSKYSRGKILAFLDSDLEIGCEDIGKYMRALSGAEIAIASKKHPDSRVTVPLTRRILSEAFHVIVRILTGIKASDTQSGLKAMRADSLKRMKHLLSVKKYAFDVELLTVARLMGLSVAELPVQIHVTGLFSMRNAARMFVDVLGVAYRLRIVKWYQSNLNNSSAVYRPNIPW